MARNRRQEQIPEVVSESDDIDRDEGDPTLANMASAARRGGRQIPDNPPPVPPPVLGLRPEFSNVLNSMNQVMQSHQQMIQGQQQMMEGHRQMIQEQQRLMREQEELQHRNEVGVAAHFERLKKNNMTVFDGKRSPEDSEYWLKELESHFSVLQTPENVKPVVVEHFLVGDAKEWWKDTAPAYRERNQLLIWEVFRGVFLENYFPMSLRRKKESDFFKLEQTDNMKVVEYAQKFNSLGQYVPNVMSNEQPKLQRFEEGLHGRIKARLSVIEPTSYAECFRKAIKVESDIQRGDAERGVKRARPMFTQGQSSKQVTGSPSTNRRRPPPRAVPQMKTPNKECDFCHRVHSGECRWKTGGCFNCGKLDHKVRDCPTMNQNEVKQAEQKSKSNASVFSLTQQGAETSEDVVTGTESEKQSAYLR